jgi:hypothetical protein
MACPENHTLWNDNYCRECYEPWGCETDFCTCVCEHCVCSCWRIVCPNCKHVFVDDK